MQKTFQQLNTFLLKHQILWRLEPFRQVMQPQWLPDFIPSNLANWLTKLEIEEIEQLKGAPELIIEKLGHHIPELAMIHELVMLPSTPIPSGERNLTLESGIPGRKWAQIQSLGQSVLHNHRGREWLEWCSGKGYLGRVLAFHSHQPVVSFEFQQSLCDSGQSEADQLSLPMTFIQGDAFDGESQHHFHRDQHAVALHACGDLHVKLMLYATQAQCCAVSFSPCCYHLIQSDIYQAQSQPGQESGLQLTKEELRIPLQETVTGGDRVKRHRQLEMSFRLGLDALLRNELGYNRYCSVPSIKKSQLSDGFSAFCLWAAEQKGLQLCNANFDYYEKIGQQRFWQMERLSLVQQPFRRLLEMWLVLDKALYLQQQGYDVELSEFCSRAMTPRNILIHATRND